MNPALKQSLITNVPAESLAGDLVQPGDPLFGLVWINPERLSGAPCFFGTRVPVKNLYDYLEHNESLESFLDDFPGVHRELAVAVLELSRLTLLPVDQAA